jgi:NAD(P)-dependent dehydrogenase (short-subunit alcohol dehydrogenase family)
MGADTARRLAEAGYDVALTARDRDRLNAVAADVERAGGRALPVTADLTDRRSIEAFADAAARWAGRCDVLCNIGIYQGPGTRQLLLDTPVDELDRSLEADVIAPAVLIQRAVPLMTAAGGVIVNMSSAVVFLSPPGTVHESGWSLAYAAAKAGIDQFAKVLNIELAEARVRVFTVEPGFVAYGEAAAAMLRKYPGSPVSPPEAIGPAIVWLVSNPDAAALLDKRVNLPALTLTHGLLPGWEGPGTSYASTS